MRNIPPLDSIERRVLAGLSQTWSSEQAAFIASCSTSLIRKAVRDGQLEAIRRVYYRNSGPGGRILRRVKARHHGLGLARLDGFQFLQADGRRYAVEEATGKEARGYIAPRPFVSRARCHCAPRAHPSR